MDKNWLIRTKSNHILGPVSKEKVLELYKNGSIKPDDEVCSGNGYWFFIREDDMVERFLLGNEVQTFNPISEAKDILTNPTGEEVVDTPRDITMVGGINLSLLHETPSAPEPIKSIQKPQPAPPLKESSPSDIKKKNNITVKENPRSNRTVVTLKKQNYLKYVAILGFLVLFLLVYFRKSIIQSLFHGEITLIQFSLIDSALAQENRPEKKKKILENSITLENVTFKPVIGLDGYKVTSSFDVEEITCSDLENDVLQLAVILYRPEVINEKFLIKMRDCVVKLNEKHPLKKWLKWVAKSEPLSQKKQETLSFLSEVINSKFNLITDIKLKEKIINTIHLMQDKTLPEIALKSYLYLMIGNITRSDNILKQFISTSPKENWERSVLQESLYHRLGEEQFSQILKKLAGHPSDRRIFELFCLYLENFYNEEELLNKVKEVDTNEVEEKLSLKYIEGIAPAFVKYLRLSNNGENRRISKLRNLEQNPLSMQSYWIWPFMDIDPLVSELTNGELQRIEKEDEMWFIYLMNNEKLADLFSLKSGRSFLPGRRPFLKLSLDDSSTFMMGLYKLIELGDINEELILKTANHLINE